MLYTTSLFVLILSGGLTLLTLMKIRKRNVPWPLMYFFNVTLLILFIVVPLIVESLGGAQTIRWYRSYLVNQGEILSVYVSYIFVFCVSCFVLVTSKYARRKQSTFLNENFHGSPRHAKYSAYLLFVVAAGLFVYVSGSGMSVGELLEASRFGWMDSRGGDGVVVLVGIYLLSVIAPASYHVFSARKLNTAHLVTLLALVALMVALSGGRKWILFLMSGYIAARYFRAQSFKMTYSDTLVLASLVFFVVIWQFGRHLTEFSQQSIGSMLYERGYQLFMEGDLSYFYRASLEAISLNIDEGVWYPFNVVRRLLFLPFPNELTFGLKPEGLPTSFAREIGAINALRVGNMPPSMIGVFALSFGAVPGIIIFGGLLPILIVKADQFLLKKSLIRASISGYGLVVIVTFARGNVDVLYYVVVYLCIFKVISIAVSMHTAAIVKKDGGNKNA